MTTDSHAKLRKSVIEMLLADRQTALSLKNPSAAITASTKVAALLLEQIAEQRQTQPVAAVTLKIMHATYCPHCRELGLVSEHSPETHEQAARARRDAAWTDDPEPVETAPAPLPVSSAAHPRHRAAEELAVPKRVIDRDGKVVRGLV